MASFKSFVKNKNCGSCTICEKSFFLTHQTENVKKDCVWQYIESLSDGWRPDKAMCFMSWTDKNIPWDYRKRVGINVELLGEFDRTFLREFVSFLSQGIKNGVPFFLVVPNGMEEPPKRHFLNFHLKPHLGKMTFTAELINILSGEEFTEEAPDTSNVIKLSSFRPEPQSLPTIA